jgi:hypothetical protein
VLFTSLFVLHTYRDCASDTVMAAEAYVVLIYTSLQNIVYMYVRCPSVTEGGPRMLVYTNLEIAVVGGNCIHWSINGVL